MKPAPDHPRDLARFFVLFSFTFNLIVITSWLDISRLVISFPVDVRSPQYMYRTVGAYSTEYIQQLLVCHPWLELGDSVMVQIFGALT